MYDIEKAKQYAWEQADWIAHSNGYFLMKDCVFFYHKGNVVFDPWNDVDGNAVDDPFSFYGKDKMDGYIGLYKDKSIRAIGRLKKTIIAVEVEGKMTYRAESGEAPTPDEICRINEAIHRAEDYGYNLRTISHRYFMVEKFYPIDFRKSSKNPIQKSKFFNAPLISSMVKMI